MELRNDTGQPVDGKLLAPDTVVGDLNALRGVVAPLQVYELSQWGFALHATVQSEVVRSIELTVKRDGQDLFSYVVEGPQPPWFSRALVSAIERAKAIDDVEALTTIWKQALSAAHLRWQIVSPRTGVAHDALFIQRILPVCPTIEEFIRTPLIAKYLVLCERNELGRSTAFFGRVFLREGIAAVVTSDIDHASGQHDVESFVLPCYPWEFLPTDHDSPNGSQRLAELQWRLESEGADSLLGALHSGRRPVIAAPASENVRGQIEDGLRRMRAVAPPDREFAGANGLSRVLVHLGVKHALVVIGFDSQSDQSHVLLRFYCGNEHACLTGTQLAFILSRAQLIASGDSATRSDVAAEIGNPALRAALLVNKAQQDAGGPPKAGRPSLTQLECFAWAPDNLLSNIIGNQLGARLRALEGVSVVEQRLGEGSSLGELLAGTQSFAVELPKMVSDSAPHLWRVLTARRQLDGAWGVEISNGLGGRIVVEGAGVRKGEPEGCDDDLVRICEAFAEQRELGEAIVRYVIDDVAKHYANQADIDLMRDSYVTVTTSDMPALDDNVGLTMHAYAGRVLAQMQLLKVPGDDTDRDRQHRIVGTFRALDVSHGELALENSNMPFYVRLILRDGKLVEIALGDCRKGTPHTGEWSHLVRFANLDIALGSKGCVAIEEELKKYFDNAAAAGNSTQRKRASNPKKIPLVSTLTACLAEIYPGQLTVSVEEEGGEVCVRRGPPESDPVQDH
jgi:hypothetical protein